MSPEQAGLGGLDIDTRTDVYSLGVMLYELLVGALPLASDELRQAGYDEIQRVIREEEPPKPSTRLTSLSDDSTVRATQRGTDARALARHLRGDLDWIIMRALEKNRKRRYETLAARFAAKEAVLKVIGTGWRDGIKWTDVEVIRQPSGQPTVRLTGEAAKVAERLGLTTWAISLTHTETHAMASAVATGD